MVGQLQPTLQSNISVVQPQSHGNVSQAFSGFFRTARGISSASGPSVSDLNKQAEMAYGQALKKALALKANGQTAQATNLAKQATVDYVATGNTPNEGQSAIYSGVTGQSFNQLAHTDDEQFDKVEWAGSEGATPWMAQARQINKTKFGSTLSDPQIQELAWSTFQNNQASQAKAIQLEADIDAGLFTDDAGVSHEVVPLLKQDYSALMGYFDAALADGYATQEEIIGATKMVNEWVVKKYGKFMKGNDEVSTIIGEMQSIVTSLGSIDATGQGVTKDLFWDVAQGIEDPIMRSYYSTLTTSPEGIKFLIQQSTGIGGAKAFSDAISNLRVSEVPETAAPSGPQSIGQGLPAVQNINEYSLGQPLNTRFTGLAEGTTPLPLDTPDRNTDGKKAIEVTTGYVNMDLTTGIKADDTARKTFATMSILSAETIAAQTNTVLSKSLLAEFASPKFIKNLGALFTVDEASAVQVATAYNSALSSELNRLRVGMSSLQTDRSVSLQLDEMGKVLFDFTAFDEAVAAAGDEQFTKNWQDIKTVINNVGIEAYLRDDKYIGRRDRDIDAFANTNLRQIMKLIDNARLVVDKQKRIGLLINKNQEAFQLYGDNEVIEAGIAADQAGQEAEAIAGEAKEAREGAISTSPLPPMEQVDAGDYGTQDNPWPIAWSEARTDDEELFNTIPLNHWFIDPDGFKRKKLQE
jgi:hypothetical protein